ncbi:hypothetical protein ACFS5L_22320 [Streptomyces phyllanthi]|uniref:hypothetical protein n=1 Tax=Streptomyces phyllanthi TaxID=1803180 RepID=UPI001D13665B|nr:hypothetical protein [Streptomyces phyllanthi]
MVRASTELEVVVAGPGAKDTVLRDTLKGVRAMIQRGRVERTGAVRSREVAYADHVPIFEVVAKGDAMAARSAMARPPNRLRRQGAARPRTG